MDALEPAVGDPLRDPVIGEAEFVELANADDTMLALGELIEAVSDAFLGYGADNASLDPVRPPKLRPQGESET